MSSYETFSNIECPACHSRTILSVDDPVHNLVILTCGWCGEAYSFNRDDLHEFGETRIFRDWRWCYEQRKRIDSVRAVNE